MAHFKVDDQLHTHPKAARAGDAAMGMWTRAGSYCMAYKTEGHVPESWVRVQQQGRKKADALVQAGMWVRCDDPEPGWQFHDWEDIQDTAEQIEIRRERSRERTRNWRKRVVEGKTGDGVRDASRDASVTVPSTSSPSSSPTHGSSVETSAAASPTDTRENGGGGDDPEWNRVVVRLAAVGIKPGGWSEDDETEARDLCAGYGWVALVDEAMTGKPPNVLRGCLTRWRQMSPPKPTVINECPEHGPHSTKVCIECHTEAIRAKKESA